MDPETSRSLFTEQLQCAQTSALAKAFGWQFEANDDRVFVLMRGRGEGKPTHLLRVTFDDFPARAPSYQFVDPKTKEAAGCVWPPNLKCREDIPGICTPGTREFHEHYHKNDAQYPWDYKTLTVLNTLAEINRLLERSGG